MTENFRLSGQVLMKILCKFFPRDVSILLYKISGLQKHLCVFVITAHIYVTDSMG